MRWVVVILAFVAVIAIAAQPAWFISLALQPRRTRGLCPHLRRASRPGRSVTDQGRRCSPHEANPDTPVSERREGGSEPGGAPTGSKLAGFDR